MYKVYQHKDLETLIKVFTFGSDDLNSCDHLILKNNVWRKSARTLIIKFI